MKKIITILIVLFSLSGNSQQLANKTCYMFQGHGGIIRNSQLNTWSNNNNGRQKFYFDMDSKSLYVFDYGISDWTLVNIHQTIQQVAESGNTLNILPLNFTNGDNSSTIGGNNIVFYTPVGTAQYNGGAMQISSNDGNYILLNPDIGLILKTKKDGLNGGSELVYKTDNLTNTRFQQATDANGIVPVIEFVEVAPSVNSIGKAGQMKIKDTTLYIWTEFGWKSTILN
jgi:hypothetical protein